MTSGTVPDARLSANVRLLGPSIESAAITDGTIVSADIATGQVVRSLNTLQVVWPAAWWGQGANCNDVAVAHNGGVNVPTWCTATAMAIKMRFHEWPPTGNGAYAYADLKGSGRAVG